MPAVFVSCTDNNSAQHQQFSTICVLCDTIRSNGHLGLCIVSSCFCVTFVQILWLLLFFFFPGVFISCCKFALHSCWASFFNMDCANCGSNRLHSQLLCGHYLCANCLTRLIEEGGYCNRCLCTCIGAEPTDTVLVTCGHSLCAFCA